MEALIKKYKAAAKAAAAKVDLFHDETAQTYWAHRGIYNPSPISAIQEYLHGRILAEDREAISHFLRITVVRPIYLGGYSWVNRPFIFADTLYDGLENLSTQFLLCLVHNKFMGMVLVGDTYYAAPQEAESLPVNALTNSAHIEKILENRGVKFINDTENKAMMYAYKTGGCGFVWFAIGVEPTDNPVYVKNKISDTFNPEVAAIIYHKHIRETVPFPAFMLLKQRD